MYIEFPLDDEHKGSCIISNVRFGGDINVLEIGYNRVPSGLKQSMKRNVYILHYVTAGKGIFLDCGFDDGGGYLVVPSEAETIRADRDDPYEIYWIMFQGEKAAEMLSRCGLPLHSGVFRFEDNKKCAEVLRKALFETEMLNEFEEKCIMQSAFYEIMALHMRKSNKINISLSHTAQRVKDFITENYHRRINITELAQMNGYTRNYLYLLFKKEYGISPREYLLSVRIEKAKQILKETNEPLSINETAYAVGFNDPLYFSRMFRKKTGLSPTEFKKSIIFPSP